MLQNWSSCELQDATIHLPSTPFHKVQTSANFQLFQRIVVWNKKAPQLRNDI